MTRSVNANTGFGISKYLLSDSTESSLSRWECRLLFVYRFVTPSRRHYIRLYPHLLQNCYRVLSPSEHDPLA